jgi:predicted enzyme related to lactoylglutathione lyase
MAYQTNHFCWHGCNSTDTAAAKAFYTKVIGWNAADVPMGDSTATVFMSGEDGIAHLTEPPAPGVPSHWNNYLRVDDVDASSASAAKNGGVVLVPPTDIPPGRFSMVASPSGATFALFHEASDESVHSDDGPGRIHWVELHSTDLDADVAWLVGAFGFETGDMPMPDGSTYKLLKQGDKMLAGAMKSQQPGTPSMWLAWFQVADVDATVSTAKEAGGNVLSPIMDMPGVGRMAMVQDPTGGVFGVITPPSDAAPQ